MYKNLQLKNLLIQQFIIWSLAWLFIAHYDQDIMLWVHHNFTGKVFNFFKIVTFIGDGYLIIAVIAIAGISFLYQFKNNKLDKAEIEFYSKILASLSYSFILSSVIVQTMKFIFGRTRPKLFLYDRIHEFTGPDITFQFHSFPSGHSATAFSFFITLCLAFPRYRLVLFALATTAAISRIIVTMHYPSDVLVGSYFGFICAIIIWYSKVVEQHRIDVLAFISKKLFSRL